MNKRQIINRLNNLEKIITELKDKVWELQNPSVYKYGYTFGKEKMKIIKVIAIPFDYEYSHVYTIDTGKGLIELGEPNLEILIDKTKHEK